tara:strand:- start:6118 stop:7023 length:906 start_codon:yes stop_codon:yes gene_type:complete
LKYFILLYKKKLETKLKRNIKLVKGLLVKKSMLLANNKKTIVHYHIQKSGGSSINHAFYSYTYDEKVFKKTAQKHKLDQDIYDELSMNYGKASYWTANRNGYYSNKGNYVSSRNRFLYEKGKSSYLHDHYLPLKFIDQDNSLSFTVIRDPLERLISKYKMDFNFIKCNFSRNFPGQNLGSNPKDPMINCIDNPIRYFNYLEKHEPRDFFGILSTFSPKFDLIEAKENLAKIDYVFKQGNLNEMFKEFLIKEKVLIPFYSGFLSREKNSEKQKFKTPNIDRIFMEELRDKLKTEYELIKEYI